MQFGASRQSISQEFALVRGRTMDCLAIARNDENVGFAAIGKLLPALPRTAPPRPALARGRFFTLSAALEESEGHRQARLQSIAINQIADHA